MAESYPAGEDLGFVALSLPTGGNIWLAAASIYALETHPNEEFTTVKTAGETLAVKEGPEQVFIAMKALEEDSEARHKKKHYEDSADHVVRWEVPVALEKERPLVILESDPWVPYLRERGVVLDFVSDDDEEGYDEAPSGLPEGPAPKVSVTSLPSDFGSHPDDAMFAAEWSQQEKVFTLGEYLRQRRAQRPEETFEEHLEDEFGTDIGDALDRARRRANGEE